MLKVVEYKEIQPVHIEYDIYTPVTVEFGTWNISKESTIYWRTGNFTKSLIEIGIGKDTGDLRSITLTLIEKVQELKYLNFDMENVPMNKGLPKCQIKQYSGETYIDEPGMLDVYIGNDKVLILFSNKKPKSMIQNNKLVFILDANNIVCGIVICSMSEHEKKVLEAALN